MYLIFFNMSKFRLIFLFILFKDSAANAEKARSNLQQQIADLQAKLAESEGNSNKGGKRVISQYESRIAELEAERDSEARSHASTTSN